MKKTAKRSLIFVLALLITGVMTCSDSFAYFQRGSVGVYAGQSSVSVSQGGSAAVSLSFSPASSSQLPGCGMAECPQICGEKDCLDANGECKCAGTTYMTYYASANAYSSNTSVATASCSGSTVYITGISPGSATITVTASLRQFTSTSTSIYVTVSGSTQAATQATTASSGQVSAKPAKKNKSKKSDKNEKENETEGTTKTVDSDRGKISFVMIPDGKTGKDALESIKGKDDFVDFQKKDDADTILYAWEFAGKDVTEPRDMDLNLEFSREAFKGCKYGSKSDSLYIQRGDKEALPGKASTYIRVADWFKDSDKLYLYSFDKENGARAIEDELSVENGYVTCSTMYGEADKYILSTEKWDVAKETVKEEKGSHTGVWIGIAAAVLIAVLAAAYIVKNRKKTPAEPLEETEEVKE